MAWSTENPQPRPKHPPMVESETSIWEIQTTEDEVFLLTEEKDVDETEVLRRAKEICDSPHRYRGVFAGMRLLKTLYEPASVGEGAREDAPPRIDLEKIEDDLRQVAIGLHSASERAEAAAKKNSDHPPGSVSSGFLEGVCARSAEEIMKIVLALSPPKR